MEHACFRAVWMYRPTCAYMVGPLKTKLQLAIQQKRTPELTCAALGYCGAAGSGPALANSTSNNNISISISINHNELPIATPPAVRRPPPHSRGTHERPQRPRRTTPRTYSIRLSSPKAVPTATASTTPCPVEATPPPMPDSWDISEVRLVHYALIHPSAPPRHPPL